MVMSAIPSDLPQRARDIAEKLSAFGYSVSRLGGVWMLRYPAGHPSGTQLSSMREDGVADELLKALRSEEDRQLVLVRYEQFDSRWGRVVYGDRPGSTTIAQSGCGPTSLAIVIQYLMNDPRRAVACEAVTPDQVAKYAEKHGRAYKRDGTPSGTAGDPMIRDLQQVWPDFEGSRVSFDEAASLVAEGRLVIFLCKGCHGWSRGRALAAAPDASYGGHYMVLAGVEGTPGQGQIFYVVDPGRNARRAMRYISAVELQRHNGGFWWVRRRHEATSL